MCHNSVKLQDPCQPKLTAILISFLLVIKAEILRGLIKLFPSYLQSSYLRVQLSGGIKGELSLLQDVSICLSERNGNKYF